MRVCGYMYVFVAYTYLRYMDAEKRYCSIAASTVGLKGAWTKVLHDGPERGRERAQRKKCVRPFGSI